MEICNHSDTSKVKHNLLLDTGRLVLGNILVDHHSSIAYIAWPRLGRQCAGVEPLTADFGQKGIGNCD